MSENIIERAMMELVHNEPFFAALLLNMTKKIDHTIPTLGVNVTDNVNLYINPFFWKSLSLAEQIDVLKHECYHVINNHFARFADITPLFSKELKDMTPEERLQAMQEAGELNRAGDYAINEYLPHLPKKMRTFDKDGNPNKGPDGKVLEGTPLFVKDLIKIAKAENIPCDKLQTTEYYYDILQKLKKDGSGGGNGKGMTIDDHSIWSEGASDPDFVTEKVKQVVNKAAEQVGGREAGNMPADVILAIEALNHKPKDWRSDLRRFVANTSEVLVESSRKKRHRRYGIQYAGNVVYERLHLACLVDTSGSVSDDELHQFVAEIKSIAKNNVVISLIEFDTAVNKVYKLDDKANIKQVTGRGGTYFAPAFDKAAELEVDGIVMFSDMGDCGQPIKKPKVPVLWACLDNGVKPPCDWGRRTTVTVKKK